PVLDVKSMDPSVTCSVAGLAAGRPLTFRTLLNQRELPGWIAVPLKLETIELTEGCSRSSSASRSGRKRRFAAPPGRRRGGVFSERPNRLSSQLISFPSQLGWIALPGLARHMTTDRRRPAGVGREGDWRRLSNAENSDGGGSSHDP